MTHLLVLAFYAFHKYCVFNQFTHYKLDRLLWGRPHVGSPGDRAGQRASRRPASSKAQPAGGAALEQPARLLEPCVKNEEDQIADTSNSG